MSNLPEMMTVIMAKGPGGPEVLGPASRPVPAPGHGQVLIKVAAAGLNGADLSMRRGRYGGGAGPEVLGLEVGGTVVAVGEGVKEWREGDELCCLLAGGGYAEYAVAPALHCLPVPRGVSLTESGGLPEAAITVWLNVFELGRLSAGERLLVHGGASGIGTMAIQLAYALGSQVYATAGSDEKCRRCEQLGAAHVINYKTEDFAAVVEKHTGGKGVDVILEMIGGDYLTKGVRSLAVGGRLAIIALKQGGKVEFDFSEVQRKEVSITGSRLMPRSFVEKARLVAAVRKAVWPQIEDLRVAPIIDRTFPLVEAAAAHAYMESGKHVGKILLVT
jgi:NADPH2:quinone reductase